MIYFLLYNILLILALPFYIIYYIFLSFKNLEYLKLLIQNFWCFYDKSSSHKLIYLHAASVGEVTALKSLITKLLANGQYTLAVSTTSITGQAQLKKMFKDKIFAFYKVYDLSFFIHLCLNKLKPSVIIIMETELWPNLVRLAKKKKILLYLINARLSDSSVKSYKKVLPLVKPTINAFTGIFTQSIDNEKKFLQLGSKKEIIKTIGNIKYDLSIAKDMDKFCLQIKQDIFTQNFCIWIAASTHRGEDELLLKVQNRLQKIEPLSLLILAPRHPQRFLPVIKLCKKQNINFVTRSSKKICDKNTQVFILDSLGELMYFYKLAKIAFIGGSLVPIGGHNPLEAIALNKPVVWGPNMFNFLEIKNLLLKKHLAKEVYKAEDLDKIILQALQNSSKNKQDCEAFINEHSGSVDKIYNIINKQLFF